MGAAIALQTAIVRPEVARTLALASVTYSSDGVYAEVLPGCDPLQPEEFDASLVQQACARIASHPERWPALIAKQRHLEVTLVGWPAAAIHSLTAPTLLIIGDSAIVRPENTIDLADRRG
jgi:pimeloyl-ACP methyl ester carboxylesterase